MDEKEIKDKQNIGWSGLVRRCLSHFTAAACVLDSNKLTCPAN
jgi:hypothetical protein